MTEADVIWALGLFLAVGGWVAFMLGLALLTGLLP